MAAIQDAINCCFIFNDWNSLARVSWQLSPNCLKRGRDDFLISPSQHFYLSWMCICWMFPFSAVILRSNNVEQTGKRFRLVVVKQRQGFQNQERFNLLRKCLGILPCGWHKTRVKGWDRSLWEDCECAQWVSWQSACWILKCLVHNWECLTHDSSRGNVKCDLKLKDGSFSQSIFFFFFKSR